MKKDLQEIDVDEHTVEVNRIAKTRRLQRMVKIGVVVLNGSVLVAFVSFVVGEIDFRKGLPPGTYSCSALAYLDKGDTVVLHYVPYFWTRFIFCVITNVWLIIVSGMLSSILKGETEGGFFKENCRILLIIWGFILTYIGWTIYDMIIN